MYNTIMRTVYIETSMNCRHIDNAAAKPLIRSICATVGYPCPEICTPLELLSEDRNHVPR